MYIVGRPPLVESGNAGTSQSGGEISAGDGLAARFDLDRGRMGIRLGRTTVVLGLVLIFRDMAPFDVVGASGERVDADGIRDAAAGFILDLVRVRVVVVIVVVSWPAAERGKSEGCSKSGKEAPDIRSLMYADSDSRPIMYGQFHQPTTYMLKIRSETVYPVTAS